ncbi:hypothetical protein AMS60_05560 [Bacillus sp. FJAT-21945]|nr:hypothetical protein AMS60_05560 [Bacillus sp. FJAT-21945]
MKSTKNQLLEEDVKSLRGDLRMYREMVEKLRKENKELISLCAWSARRLHKVHKHFAYDELDRITNTEIERL